MVQSFWNVMPLFRRKSPKDRQYIMEEMNHQTSLAVYGSVLLECDASL